MSGSAQLGQGRAKRRHSGATVGDGLEQIRTATAKQSKAALRQGGARRGGGIARLRLAPRRQGQAGMCNGKGQLRPAPRRHGIAPRRKSNEQSHEATAPDSNAVSGMAQESIATATESTIFGAICARHD